MNSARFIRFGFTRILLTITISKCRQIGLDKEARCKVSSLKQDVPVQGNVERMRHLLRFATHAEKVIKINVSKYATGVVALTIVTKSVCVVTGSGTNRFAKQIGKFM